MKRPLHLLAVLTMSLLPAFGAENGLGLNLGEIYKVSNAKSRSISPENFSGEKGKGSS